jgi:hypothetical protein
MLCLPRFNSSATRLFGNSIQRRRKLCFRLFCWLATPLAFALCLTPVAGAQSPATLSGSSPRPLITGAVDDGLRTTLRGNTHPLVRKALDQGTAPSSLPMQHMILILKRSAEQESALSALLDAQQTKGSASYHQWLAPRQFGQQFGPADSDIAAVEAWLESHGLKVDSVSNGRTAIEFSGTAGQVQDVFKTTIHSYLLNGEQHWANASDPSIPSALAPLVKGVLSLHNFPRQAQFTVAGARARAANSGAGTPLYTFTSGKSTYYAVGPTDFATIYNVLPLWKSGIDGSGQTIAIVGETDINLSDIKSFRSLFGLPANVPKIIVNGPDPGISLGDEPEAVLDVSWSGAVAKNATIELVASASTSTALGVDLSALYIVDNNLAPIMSESYGECEASLGDAGNAFYNSLWEQAAAEGITVVEAAGDGGSAGCDNFDTEATASQGLGVSGFASTPYNVAVGGTDFDQSATTAVNYWSTTNAANTEASALGYIPETTWNQSCAGLGLSGGVSQCPASSTELNIVAGSGGPSRCATGADSNKCAGYPKPSWQTGTGVPQDGVRDLPDVSLFASAGFNGSFYVICEQDFSVFGPILGFDTPCSLINQTFVGLGGTSAAAPAFAGMLAMVEQKTGSRQGNANYVLYNLAAQSGASCDSSATPANRAACVFYDITKGNDAVPCSGTLDCGFAPSSNGYGIMMDPSDPTVPAFTTTPGYDLATGLGTVNATNLVTAWSNASFSPSTTTLTSLTPTNLTHGQAVSASISVAAKNGTGTPTGSVSLMAAANGGTTAAGNLPLVNGTASGTTTLLPGGTYNVTAHYPGDGTFAASDSAPVQVTVGKESSQTTLLVEAYNLDNRTFSPASPTVAYGSIFYLRGDVANAAGAPCLPSPFLTQVPCPTGSLSFTLPGEAAATGSLALNTLGYAEDEALYGTIQSAGSYAIQAQYSGDASYNAGSPATMNLVVTPAPTAMAFLEIPDLAQQFGPDAFDYVADSGQTFHVETAVTAASVRPAPTGAVTFLENGTAVPGTVAYVTFNGTPALNGAWTYLNAELPVTIDTPGTYTFTATYPGDGNYMAAQTAYSVPVLVSDQTFEITPPIPNVTVTAGQTGTTNVTLTATDNFGGVVNVTCTLPAPMAEATCSALGAALGNNTTATATITITTTAQHTLTSKLERASPPYGFALLACVFLLFPIGFRRKLPLLILFVVLAVGFNGCGRGGGQAQQDQGTPPGTYTVTVTAASSNITRTSTFTVTVQ